MERLKTGWIKPTSENPGIARMQMRASALIPGLILISFMFSLANLVISLIQAAPTTGLLFLAATPLLLLTGWLYRIEFTTFASVILILTLNSLLLALLFTNAPSYLLILALFVTVTTCTYMFSLVPAVLILLLSQTLIVSAGWFASALSLPAPVYQPATDEILIQTAALIFTAGLLHLFLHNPARILPLSSTAKDFPSPGAEEVEEELVEARTPVRHHAPGEIARLATRASTPDAVLTRACELIQEIGDYYHVGIYLLDESETWAEMATGTGPTSQNLLPRQHRLAVGSASLIGWVTANRLPRIAQDATRDPFFYRHPLLPDTRSEMVYPLLIGEHLIGVLDVQSSESRAFTGENLRILEASVNELAIAIENARLLMETRQRLDRIEREYSEQSMESWQRILREKPELEIRRGHSADTDPHSLDELISKAASLGQTCRDNMQGTLAVPIRVRGQTIATIALRKPETGEAWSEDDIALIEALSSQTSLALETARQYTEEQRRVAELEVINRISQAVSQLLRLDTLYRVVHTQIRQVLLNADLTIALYDEDTGILTFPYSTRKLQPADIKPTRPAEDAFGDVLANRQPVLLNSRVEINALLGGAEAAFDHAQSWLAVPMLFGNEIIGLIALHDPGQEHRFSEDDSALLTTISSQVATAIQNSNLLNQIRSSARREQMIREITTRIRRAPDLQSILDTSVKELGRALNVSMASVHLGLPGAENEKNTSRIPSHPDFTEEGL